MLPQSRGEKLALAKDKLNKFQKTRTRTSQSIVLETAIIGTQVNGHQLSSMMSSHGGSSANGEKMSDTKTFKSLKSSSSSPRKLLTGLGVENTYISVLSPIKSEGALSLVNGLDNLQIKSAESNGISGTMQRNLPLPIDETAMSGSPTISHAATERHRHASATLNDRSENASADFYETSYAKAEELHANNKELSEKIQLLEEAIANLKELFNSDKEALLQENQQLAESLSLRNAHGDAEEKIKSLEEELALAISERDVLEKELNDTLHQLADSRNDTLETDTMRSDEIEALKAQLEEYQSIIESLQTAASAAQQVISELQAAKQLIQEDGVSGGSERNDESFHNQQLISQLQQSIHDHSEVENKLRNQIATLVYQVDKAEESDAHSQQEISRLRILVQNQTKQLEELDFKLQTVEVESELEIASLLQKIAILEAELELVKANESADPSDPVQARVIHYRTEAESLRKENQELHDRISVLEEEIQSLASQSDSQLLNIIQEKTEEIETIKQQSLREQQTDDLKIAQLHLKTEQQAVALHEARSRESSRNPTPVDSFEIKSLREQLEIMEREYREQIFHLNREIASLREGASTAGDNNLYLIEELQAVNDAQALELQTAQIDMEQLKLQHFDEVEALKQQVAESVTAGTSENELLMELQRVNEDLMFELETLRINVANQEQVRISELKKAKKDAADMEQFYQAEMELLNQRIRESSSGTQAQDLAETLQVENEALAFQIENLNSEMTVERESNRLIIETLQDQINSTPEMPAKFEEVAEMKGLIESQHNQIKSLQEQAQTMEAEIREECLLSSKEKTDDLKSKNLSLLSNIEELKATSEGLQFEKEGLVVELETLKISLDQVRGYSDEANELRDRNMELQHQIENLQIELVSKQETGNWGTAVESTTAVNQDSEALQNRVTLLEDRLESKTQELLSVSSELEYYRIKAEDTQDQAMLLETSRDLMEKNAELKSKLSILQEQVQQSSSLPAPDESLVLQLQEEMERVLELEAIIESNAVKYSEMISSHEEEVRSYVEKVVDLERGNQAANAAVEEVKLLLQESEDYCAQLVEVIDSNKSTFEQMLSSHEAQVQEYQSHINGLKTQVASSVAASVIEDVFERVAVATSTEEDYSKLSTDFAESQEAQATLTNEKDALLEKIASLDAQVYTLNNELSVALAGKEGLAHALTAMETQLEETKNQQGAVDTSNEQSAIQAQLSAASQQIEYLNTCLHESEARYADIYAQFESNNSYYSAALAAEMEEKKLLLDQLQSLEITKSTAHHSSDLTDEIESLKAAIAERDQIIAENAVFIAELQLNSFAAQPAEHKEKSQEEESGVIGGESPPSVKRADQISALEEMVDRLRQEKNELETHLLQLQSDNQQLTAQASFINQNHEGQWGTPADENVDLNVTGGGVTEVNETQALQASLQESDATIKALEMSIQENNEKFQEQFAEEAASMSLIRAQVEVLLEKIREFEGKEKQLEENVSKANIDLQTKNDEYAALLQQVHQKEESHEEDLKRKRAELEKVLLELETCNLSLVDLRSQLEQANSTAIQWEEYCSKTLAEQDVYYQAQIEQLQSSNDGHVRHGLYPPQDSTLGDVSIDQHSAKPDVGNATNNAPLTSHVDDFAVEEMTHSDVPQTHEDNALSEELANLQQQHEDVLFELKAYQKSVEEKAQTIESLSGEVSEHSAALQSAKDSIALVFSHLQNNDAVLDEFSYSSNAQNEEVSMVAKLEKISAELNRLYSNQHQSFASEEEVVYLRQQLKQLQYSLDESLLAKQSLESEIQRFTQSLERESEAKNDLEGRLTLLREQVDEKESALQAAVSHSSGANDEIALQSASLLAQISDLTGALETEKGEKSNLLASKAELEVLLEESKSHFEEHEARMAESALVIEEWQQYASTLEQQKEELSQELSRVSEEFNLQIGSAQDRLHLLEESEKSYSAQCTELKERLQEAQSQLDDARQAVVSQTSTAELEEKIFSLNLEVEGKNSELARLEQGLTEIQGLRERLDEADLVRSDILGELKAKASEAESHSSKLETLEREMREKMAELESLKEEKQNLNLSLQQRTEERDDAYQKMTQYNEYISGLEEEKASLLRQFEESQHQTASYNQEQFDGFQFQINSLTEQLNAAYENDAALRSGFDEAVDLSNSKDAAIKQFQAKIESLEEAQRHSISCSDEKLNAAERTIKQLQEEFDELAVLYATSAREVEDLKSRFISQDASPTSLQESLNVTERMALNNLITSLESEKTTLMGDIKRLKAQLALVGSEWDEKTQLLESRVKSLERRLADATSAEEDVRAQARQLETQIKALEDEVHHLQTRMRDSERLVSKYQADLAFCEERVKSAEMDRDHYLQERNRSRDQFDLDIAAEQARAREHLQFRLNELRAGFDTTMDELQRKHNHLEQLLDDSERQLIEERNMHHQREQALAEDARYFQNANNNSWVPPSPRLDFTQDRMLLDQRVNELLNENRRLHRIVDAQGNEFLKERYGLLNEIAALKHDLETVAPGESNIRIVKKLQEQKNELEFRLSQKEEQMSRILEARGWPLNPELDRQKQALENILATREAELGHAEMKIHQLLNERDERLDELEFLNKQLKNQIRSFGTLPNDIRVDFSNLQTAHSEVLLIVGEMFTKTVGFGPSVANPSTLAGTFADIARLKSRCIALVQDFLSLKEYSNRLSLWRSDLVYQKRYLCLKVDDLEASAETMIEYLGKQGLQMQHLLTSSSLLALSQPRQKWKRSFNCIIAILRMKKLSLKRKLAVESAKSSSVLLFAAPSTNPAPLSPSSKQARFQLPIPTH